MGLKFFDKILVFFGLAEEEVDHQEMASVVDSANPSNRKGKVVSLHTSKNLRVIVAEPKDFDEAQSIAENLKNKLPVVINLEGTELEISKRLIDFISGAAYALNANYQKISNHIFIFTPNNIDINSTITRSEVNAFTTGSFEDSELDD
ncbi:cell division protein SepF [Candidatus Contubernalis alkaliaceticus]|uniref:cell division protein SepF n=1 Tax=Candidatus Contubernalis alkaliaceticus TaxID=338645 RepID=UPI001F4C4970|nr:cell division protein SepF [Candidatus Contubernalis alkalaceticus]